MATKKSTDTPAKKTTKAPSKTAGETSGKLKPASESEADTPSNISVASKTPPAVLADQKQPTHEEISHLAHHFWKERGHHHGSHEDDWTRAECELKSPS